MILLIDNYDSFTYNLVHFLGELGAQTQVYRNDVFASPQKALENNPQALVLSPGPCTPDKAGICLELVQAAAAKNLPILGVCLGHQVLAQAFGAKIIRAPAPMHGKLSPIHHNSSFLFEGLPSQFEATRYHSLVVEQKSLPASLTVTAHTEQIIMALKHKTLPFYGVQFHPESIACAEVGRQILKNFLNVLPS